MRGDTAGKKEGGFPSGCDNVFHTKGNSGEPLQNVGGKTETLPSKQTSTPGTMTSNKPPAFSRPRGSERKEVADKPHQLTRKLAVPVGVDEPARVGGPQEAIALHHGQQPHAPPPTRRIWSAPAPRTSKTSYTDVKAGLPSLSTLFEPDGMVSAQVIRHQRGAMYNDCCL